MRTDDQYTWNDEDHIYPLTVIKDRYHGCYSGGAYTAWNLDAEEVPKEIYGDDITCLNIWSDLGEVEQIVGKGATIEEAVADLRNKLFHRSDD